MPINVTMASRSRRTKICPSCHPRTGPLPISAFGQNNNNPDGHATYCKACSAAKQRDWKAANADKVREWRKAYVARIKKRNKQREREARA